MTAQSEIAPARAADPPPTKPRRARNQKVRKLTRTDLIVVSVMVAVPTLLVLVLVWFPAVATVALSFTNWNGIGALSSIKVIGADNYTNVATNYPPFWPALQHNLLWLAVLFVVATPFGMFLAVLLDKEIKGSRIYQTAFYLPVIMSLALVGFVWQLIYSRDQGILNAVLGTQIDWYGDSSINLWAALVAAMRAFDLVYVINKGRNGLETIATLVTQNVVGEASRVGFGSAMATIMLVISSIFVAIYLTIVMREERSK